MPTAFVAGIITTLAFGGFIAWRFSVTRNKLGFAVAIFMVLETLALAFLFFKLSRPSAAGEIPWLEVLLRPLALQVLGAGVAGAALGSYYFLVLRVLAPGHQLKQGTLFGLLIPLLVGALILGVWAVQERPYRAIPGFEIVPESTRQPESGDLQLVRAFSNLSFNQLTNLVQPDDGTNRIFVTEQEGRILVFPNDEKVIEVAVFLDIGDRVIHNAATNPRKACLDWLSTQISGPTDTYTFTSPHRFPAARWCRASR